MNIPNPDAERFQQEGKKYFLIGYLLLVLMAISWSLEQSFVYIFLGAGSFFIYLGISSFVKSELIERGAYRSDSSGKPFSQWWSDFTRKRESTSYSRPNASPENAARVNRGKIVRFVVWGFGSLIAFFVVVGILSDDNGEFENTANGDSYFLSDNFDSAKVFYQRALRVNADNFDANLGLAKSLVQFQSYDSAILYFDRALSIDPNSQEALRGKGETYVYMERYDDALTILKPIVEQTDDYSRGNLFVGDCYYLQDNLDAALPFYIKAYELGERSKELSNILGYIYDKKEETQKAIPFYEEALTYGDDPEIQKRLEELKR